MNKNLRSVGDEKMQGLGRYMEIDKPLPILETARQLTNMLSSDTPRRIYFE
jgi:hypothetical protein